ncbi:MAG: septal ring lytic transglycosylase RlpA family lipoprotein [Terriglobia bacterium]|nr:MAG: septal ring lytic transglycosylase RlpA family lipoprotein [Terriglobia bacterium]
MKRVLLIVVSCSLLAANDLEQGLASWYGESFHGQRAASGEIYDMQQMTAAHRTLPFGTSVRVRRLDSGASVVVRINDRGPEPESRIIDLSRAAAQELGIVTPGVVPVALEVVKAPSANSKALYAVQVGTFRNFDNARRTRVLISQNYSARIVTHHGETDLWSVLAGECPTRLEAESLAGEIRAHVAGMRDAYVVRIETGASIDAD